MSKNKKNRFELVDQLITDKLVGKNVLLMIKENLTLQEATIVDFTRHLVRVKILKSSIFSTKGLTIGLKRRDVTLFPMRISRKKLENLIKTSNAAKINLKNFIEQFSYNITN